MRKLVLKMSVSVDGFVGGPNGDLDWIFKSMDGRTRKLLRASSFLRDYNQTFSWSPDGSAR